MFFNRLLYCLICVFLSSNLYLNAQQSSMSNTNTTMYTKLIQPPYLKAGDTVAIVAPSGILNHREKEVNQAIDLLKDWDLNVVVGDHVYKKAGHFAGTDDERCEDFQKALDNPNIKAIWCARGGYGTVRILDKIDYSKYKDNPKWIIGYSDITAIHNQLNNIGSESIHAMMCTSLTDDLEAINESLSSFKATVFGESITYFLEGSEYNKTGTASGQLVGGNLTMLHTMLGSETSINTSEKILFIEEIGEYKYHIDRMLQSLKRAGYFDNCKGVIVGDMTKLRKNTTLWGTSIEQLILDALAEYNFPIVFNMPAGHEKDNRAMILGRNVKLTIGKEQSLIVFDN